MKMKERLATSKVLMDILKEVKRSPRDVSCCLGKVHNYIHAVIYLLESKVSRGEIRAIIKEVGLSMDDFDRRVKNELQNDLTLEDFRKSLAEMMRQGSVHSEQKRKELEDASIESRLTRKRWRHRIK